MVSCTALADGTTCQPSASSVAEHRRVDRLDLGDDEVGAMLLDRRAQRRAVEHREDFARVGDLHRRRVVVAVAGDDPAAEPLGGDGEFAAELARAEQHEGGKIHGRALTSSCAKEMSMRRSAARFPLLP